MSQYPMYPEEFKNIKMKPRENACFLIMKFGKETDQIYKTILRATKKCGVECDRSDTLKRSEPFFNKIVSSIACCNYLIVDISGLNPNVFYELGIAHTLRDAKNILILKDSTTDCPSDIKYITYFQYNKENLNELYRYVVDFFRSASCSDNLLKLLYLLDTIPDDMNNNEVAEILESKLRNSCYALFEILSNNGNAIDIEERNYILSRLFHLYLDSCDLDSSKVHIFYMRLLLQTVNRLIKIDNLNEFINDLFNYDNHLFPNMNELNNLRTEITEIFLSEDLSNIYVYKWIKHYLDNSSPASIDICKYKLQISLIKNNGCKTNEFIYDVLRKDNGETLIEHILNICKEKRMIAAIPIALTILGNTANPYVFRSSIDLITEVGSFNEIIKMLSIVSSRKDWVNKNDFINKHIVAANSKLSSLKPTNS